MNKVEKETDMTEKYRPYVVEEQTGRVFEIRPEQKADRALAICSVVYLIIMIFFFLWQLFDIWVGRFTLAKWFGYIEAEPLTESATLICIYTFIGGALGGIVNEIRGFLFWHCDNEAFGRRYFWKTIVAPWLGGTLGIFVYFLTRSGIALFTGEFIPSEQTVQQAVPMFTIGALAGYGSRKVFVWLDAQVTRIFSIKKEKVKTAKYAKVPNLIGMTKEEAEIKLTELKLGLGDISSAPAIKKDLIGKVISQGVKPELSLDVGSTVDITVGIEEGQ